MIKKLLLFSTLSLLLTGCSKPKTYVVIDENNDTTYVQGYQSYSKQGIVVIITKDGFFRDKRAYFGMSQYRSIYEKD